MNGTGLPAERSDRLKSFLGATAAWLVGMAVFYREVLVSGFDRLNGNAGDQRLLVFISEHWYLVAKGQASWRDPSYFFPTGDVLGYTESILLYQPIYVPLRLLGLDQFAAFQVTLMVLSTIGFGSMFVLLRRMVGVRVGVAIAGAFVFAFANNVAVKMGHGQMMAVQLVPVLLLLGGASIRAAGARRPVAGPGYGALAGLMLALLFFTSFYVAWFTVLGAAVLAVCVLVCEPALGRSVWRRTRVRLDAVIATGGAAGIGFIVGIVPFLVTYVPVLDTSGGRPFSEVLSFSPRVGDLLNLGSDNLLWSRWLDVLPVDRAHQVNIERALALTPLLVLTTVGGLVVLLLVRSPAVDPRRLRVAAALLLAALVLTLLGLRFGDWTAWRAVWAVVPGAKAIRAVDRMQLVIGPAVVVAWALVVDETWTVVSRSVRVHRQRLVLVAVAVVVALVGFEQLGAAGHAYLDRSAEVSALATVPPMPAGCTSFYVTDPPPDEPPFVAQIDGMLISHVVSAPTLNGYSGFNPPGWGLLAPADPAYRDQVRTWVGGRDVPAPVCSFDLTARSWSEVQP